MCNSDDYARMALKFVVTDDAAAIVYALLAIAEELEDLKNMFGETIQQDGCIKVDNRK